MTRQLGYHLEPPLRAQHPDAVKDLIKDILREEDVQYVVITDRHKQTFSSTTYQSWQTIVRPEEVYTSVCKNDQAVIRKLTLTQKSVYDVGVRIPLFSSPAASRPNAIPQAAPERSPQQSQCGGTVHIGYSSQSAASGQRRLFLLFSGLAVLTAFIGISSITYVYHTFFTPLWRLMDLAKSISNGDTAKTRDQVLHNELHVLQTALSNISRIVTHSKTSLKKGCKQLAMNSETLLTISTRQTSVTENRERLLNRVSGNIDMLGETSQRIAIHLQHVLSQLESSRQSIQQMNTVLCKTTGAIEDIRRQVVNNTERVVSLGEKISQIRNVVKIITTIADQTKIIAINASIEAAGAGETGERFSVVATEVRRLANTVVESVEEIKASVSSIQTATSELILSSETGIRKVEQGSLLAVKTEKVLQTLTTSLEETTCSAHEISQTIHHQQNEHQQLTEGLTQLSSISERTAEHYQHADEIIRELSALVKELNDSLQGIPA